MCRKYCLPSSRFLVRLTHRVAASSFHLSPFLYDLRADVVECPKQTAIWRNISHRSPFHNFVELHRAWAKKLDSSDLNKRFYQEVSYWYLWAKNHAEVKLPKDVDSSSDEQRSIFFIRLLTRLIFCWFLQEIALDPELLGKVFEDLLASYNDDTKTIARKKVGAFYTPRDVVRYMVDDIPHLPLRFSRS